MADNYRDYPNLFGSIPRKNSYDNASDGAPDTHLVFTVPENADSTLEIAQAVMNYRQNNLRPLMSLYFAEQGVISVDECIRVNNEESHQLLMASIARVKRLPIFRGTDRQYTHEGICFATIPSIASHGGIEATELLFDVDPNLHGRLIAERALEKFRSLSSKIDWMTLRWPNGGIVFVDHYDDSEHKSVPIRLVTAVQRARHISKPEKLTAVA